MSIPVRALAIMADEDDWLDEAADAAIAYGQAPRTRNDRWRRLYRAKWSYVQISERTIAKLQERGLSEEEIAVLGVGPDNVKRVVGSRRDPL